MDKQKTHPTMSVKDVFLLIGGALILILLFLNIGPVDYKLFFWTIRISKLLVILFMAGAGFLAGYLVARRRHKKKAQAAVQPPAAPNPPQPPAGPSQPRA
ncbi:MAG TPA: hypothetical protein VGB72_01840 [Acidobacteriota bacterium]